MRKRMQLTGLSVNPFFFKGTRLRRAREALNDLTECSRCTVSLSFVTAGITRSMDATKPLGSGPGATATGVKQPILPDPKADLTVQLRVPDAVPCIA